MKELYNIDMEKTQYSKLLSDIPSADIIITMGCNVNCPAIPCKYREDWGLNDPTGMDDKVFKDTIYLIQKKMIDLSDRIKSGTII